MEFISETHTTSFQPKLNDDNYCYYVDDTNWNIMMLAVRDYEKHILRMPGRKHFACCPSLRSTFS